MQVVRTVVWAVISAILVAFIAMNWNDAAVNFWPIEGDNAYLHFEWPVGVIALVFFLLGFVPMWLLYRARIWQMQRRISGLENSVRAAAAVTSTPAETTVEPPPIEPAPDSVDPADPANPDTRPES